MIKTIIFVVIIIILLVWFINRKAKAEENSIETADKVEPSEEEAGQDVEYKVSKYIFNPDAFIAL